MTGCGCPASTAANFGAVSAIRRLISSAPPTTYLSRHGEPVDGVVDTQSWAMLEKPMSLPLIVTVTSAVSADSESNCGGLGSGETPCGGRHVLGLGAAARRVAVLGVAQLELGEPAVVAARLQAAPRRQRERDQRPGRVRVAERDEPRRGLRRSREHRHRRQHGKHDPDPHVEAHYPCTARRNRHASRVPGRDIVIIGATLDLGQGRRGVDMGPSAIRYAGLEARLASLGYACEDRGNVDAAVLESTGTDDEHARYLPAIKRTCERVAERVAEAASAGRIPLVLGGDHSVALGTIGGLAAAHGGPGAALWIDAHGDLNTPDTSPSGNVHGMPRRGAAGPGRRAVRERGVAAARARPPGTWRTSACASWTRASGT